MAKRTRPILAKSIRALAKQCGRAESTVRKWIRKDTWAFSLEPPWDVAKVKAWAEIQLKADPAAAYRKKAKAAAEGRADFAGMGELTKARLQAVIERALYIRQKRLVEAGKLHDAEVCQQGRLRKVHEVKSALLGLGRSLAHSLVGQDAETIERILGDRCRQICEDFAREQDGGEIQG